MRWVPPEPRLEAAGVALRPFCVSDAAAVADACKDPDILRFTFMADHLTEAGAVEWIKAASEGHGIKVDEIRYNRSLD